MKDRKGKTLKLSDIIRNRGNKYLLVDFWDTWCRPCCEQFPQLKEIYSKYHNNGFEVFAVSLGSDKGKWNSYIDENGLDWLHGISETNFSANHIVQDYAMSGIPDNLLIDCQTGIIIGRDMPMEVLESKMEELPALSLRRSKVAK